jgi:hypothetical protein
MQQDKSAIGRVKINNVQMTKHVKQHDKNDINSMPLYIMRPKLAIRNDTKKRIMQRQVSDTPLIIIIGIPIERWHTVIIIEIASPPAPVITSQLNHSAKKYQAIGVKGIDPNVNENKMVATGKNDRITTIRKETQTKI